MIFRRGVVKCARMRLNVRLNRPVQRRNNFFPHLLKPINGVYTLPPNFSPSYHVSGSSKLSRNNTLNLKMSHCLNSMKLITATKRKLVLEL